QAAVEGEDRRVVDRVTLTPDEDGPGTLLGSGAVVAPEHAAVKAGVAPRPRRVRVFRPRVDEAPQDGLPLVGLGAVVDARGARLAAVDLERPQVLDEDPPRLDRLEPVEVRAGSSSAV